MLLLKNDHGEGEKTFYGRMADIFGLPGNVVRHPVCFNNSARCKRLWPFYDGTIEHFISKILKMLALEDFLIKGLI
jgi:hypothetical protein